MSTPTLPIEGITRCGYCGQRLTMHAVDDWRCARCAPELAQITTPTEWVEWQRKTWKRYGL